MMNKFLVGAQGKSTIIQNPPRGPITADEALELAAWIVAVSAPHARKTFEQVLEEVTA